VWTRSASEIALRGESHLFSCLLTYLLIMHDEDAKKEAWRIGGRRRKYLAATPIPPAAQTANNRIQQPGTRPPGWLPLNLCLLATRPLPSYLLGRLPLVRSATGADESNFTQVFPCNPQEQRRRDSNCART